MNGHTEGQWRAEAWSCHAATTILVDDASLVTGKRIIAECETVEDARLIAAAPMLLEALKPIAALRKHFTSKHGTRPTSGVIAAWHTAEGSDELTVEHLIAAVEAIAAATGEPK